LPAYQGRGIGTTLIRRLQQRARKEGVPVTLQVFKVNPARALYERLGFKVTGETDTHCRMKWSSVSNEREEPCRNRIDVR
jgi:ribosomal protein S18 acetylase RimI-like enzyme